MISERFNIFGGLFGRSAIVRLSKADEPHALALDGAGWFAPMGDGRVSKTSIMLPESVMDDPGELKDWLRRAFDHAITLPPKAAKKPATTKNSGMRNRCRNQAAPSTTMDRPVSAVGQIGCIRGL